MKRVTNSLENGINLGQYLTRSQRNQLILHGTMDTPDLDMGQDYPKTWEDKIRYAVINRPHIAAKQIYFSSSELECWYPVGLVVSDGIITSCSGLSDTLPNGDRVPIREKPEEIGVLLEQKLESAKFYEVAVRNPSFSVVYLHDDPLHYQIVPRLSVRSVNELAQSLGLPAVIFRKTAELFQQLKG
jgi:hypothetical protein